MNQEARYWASRSSKPALIVISVLLISFIFGSLGYGFYLQQYKGEFLQHQGKARHHRTIVLVADRGKIVDRNGRLLAESSLVNTVCVNSLVKQATPEQIKRLTALLGLSVATVQKKIAGMHGFLYIKRQIPPHIARRVMALKIPGVFLQDEYQRYYPEGESLAQVLGSVNRDGYGKEGIELWADKVLRGVAGSQRVIRDRQGNVIDVLEEVDSRKGNTLTLSLDMRAQHIVHRELSKAVAAHHARAGSAVVLDAKTGEVLAIANVPTHNPNNRQLGDQARTRNRAVTDVFEPGSTAKPFAVAVALQTGRYTPDTVIQTSPGYFKVGRHTIHDTHAYNELSLQGILQKSSNVGIGKIALTLSPSAMWNMFDSIGFGKKASSGFPGERSGSLRPFKNWRPIEQVTMSYGHGISVTLLQLVRAYTPFANGGELLPISFVKLDTPSPGRMVMPQPVANQIKDMLELVVQQGGTAPLAKVWGYRVGGKTGTTVKLGESGRYEHNKFIGSFVGFAPASEPRFVMAIMIDEPHGREYYGGIVAAPVFSKTMTEMLRLYAVPQDAPQQVASLYSKRTP